MLSPSQIQLRPPKDWSIFETLCRDLFGAHWEDFFVQKNARSGHRQDGVDVYGIPKRAKGYTGVQCKCPDLRFRETLTVRELRGEVAKARRFSPRLKQYVVATPLPRDPKIQQVAREITAEHRRRRLFPVNVYFWDDIIDMLDDHPHIANKYYGVPASALPSTGVNPLRTAEPSASNRPRRAHRPTKKPLPVILPLRTQHALGLIATSPIPFIEQWFALFFPNTPWSEEIHSLVDAGIVTLSDNYLQVDDAVTQQFLPREEDRHRFLQDWIGVLQPLRAHSDTALLLSIQQIRTGTKQEAIDTLLDVAYNLEPGTWNETYRKTLLSCDNPKLLRHLSPEEKMHFLNVLGLCQVRSHDALAAIPFFRRLRTYSRRIGNAWGVGQSYINEGVALIDGGRSQEAVVLYRRAVAHAKRHRDRLLLGRALHNLVMLTSETDVDEAERLLARSIKAKRAAADNPDGPTPLFSRGLLAAKRGDFKRAIRWFTQAEKAAARRDNRDFRCTCLCNIGKAYLDVNDPGKALRFFSAARTICEQEGFERILLLALGGEAYAHYLLSHHALAAPLFRQRHDVLLRFGLHAEAAISLHDTAVMLARAGDPTAPRVFTEAIAFARTHGATEWVYQSYKDQAFLLIEKAGNETGMASLHKAIHEESTGGNSTVAARLQQDLIQHLIEKHALPSDIKAAFNEGFALWQNVPKSRAEYCHLLKSFFSWHWSSGRFSEAIATLRELSRRASRWSLPECEAAAFDQLGLCLQQLGDYEQAERSHRRAIAIARAAHVHDILENALNNLGEVLRTIDRPQQALKPLSQAEALASRRGDGEAVVSIAHNRALAIFEAGQYAAAERLLRNCRDRAARFGWHDQFVRAEHGLANFAWQRKRPVVAEQLYIRGLRDAVRYGVRDELWRLSLNYGGVLEWKKQFRRAIQSYRAAIDACINPVDRYQCLEVLGRCYERAGEHAVAIRTWKRFRAMAEINQDAGRIALAFAAVAEVHAAQGRFAKAAEEYENALRHEHDRTDRTHLLFDYFEVLLAANKEKEAAKVFRQVRARARKNSELKDLLVKGHLVIGQHNWADGTKPLEALKAFVVALSDAYSVNIDRAFDVGTSFLRIFMAIPRSERMGRIDDYERKLTEWLRHQRSKPLSPAILRSLLWPLRVARRLTAEPADGKRLSYCKITNILAEEVGVTRLRSQRNRR
jgi:tetratricopeptide (TPR) repeat protein